MKEHCSGLIVENCPLFGIPTQIPFLDLTGNLEVRLPTKLGANKKIYWDLVEWFSVPANSGEETEKNAKSRSHQKKANRQRRRQRSPSTSSTEDASSAGYSNSSDSRSESDEATSISEEEITILPAKLKSRVSKTALRNRKQSRHPRKNSSSSSQMTVSGGAESNEGGINNSNDEEEGDNGDSDTSMNSDSQEYFEARDRWIASLYRFMDQRRTPINKAPSIANKDLDLYKLFRASKYNLIRSSPFIH